MQNKKLVLFGASGHLGHWLHRALMEQWQICAPTHTEVDLTNEELVRCYLSATRPMWIVNATALANVDRAERDRMASRHINADIPAMLAAIADEQSARLVHFSTDYVFDGQSLDPYREDDACSPINWYGQTKREGELELLASPAKTLIIRTSTMFSSFRDNFLTKIADNVVNGESIQLYGTQVNRPTSARWLANVTAELLQIYSTSTKQGMPPILHAAQEPAVSRYHLALHIVQWLSRRGFACPTIQTSAVDERHNVAPRPSFTSLSTKLLSDILGHSLETWLPYVNQMLEQRTMTRRGGQLQW